jgi:hypothetical protein
MILTSVVRTLLYADILVDQVQTLMSVGDFAPVLPRSKEKFLFKKPSVSVKRAASCASAAL